MSSTERVVRSSVPVAVGTSRKGFLGAALGAADGAPGPTTPDDRLAGSVTTAVWAATMGAGMLRVHDVRETVNALAIAGAADPSAVCSLAGVP